MRYIYLLLLTFFVSVESYAIDKYQLTYTLEGQKAYHILIFSDDEEVTASSYLLFSSHLRDDSTDKKSACDIRLAFTLAEVQRRTKSHIIIYSGHRTVERNAKLNGARLSQHLNCTAVDFELVDYSAEETAVIVVAVLDDLWGSHFGGVGVNRKTIHIDTGPRRFWRGDNIVNVKKKTNKESKREPS